MTWQDHTFAVLVYLSLPAALLYPLVYTYYADWWKSEVGRALTTKAVGLAIMLTFTGCYQMFGATYPGRDILRVGGMAFIFVGVWMALVAMIKAMRRGRRRTMNRPGEK